MSDELDLVQRYLGVPFKKDGEDLNGLDCRGLLKLAYREFGKGKEFIEDLKLWEKVQTPSFFDVVLFCDKKGVASHVGIYLHENNMLHCRDRVGVVVSRIKRLGDNNVLDGFYRLKET